MVGQYFLAALFDADKKPGEEEEVAWRAVFPSPPFFVSLYLSLSRSLFLPLALSASHTVWRRSWTRMRRRRWRGGQSFSLIIFLFLSFSLYLATSFSLSLTLSTSHFLGALFDADEEPDEEEDEAWRAVGVCIRVS